MRIKSLTAVGKEEGSDNISHLSLDNRYRDGADLRCRVVKLFKNIGGCAAHAFGIDLRSLSGKTGDSRIADIKIVGSVGIGPHQDVVNRCMTETELQAVNLIAEPQFRIQAVFRYFWVIDLRFIYRHTDIRIRSQTCEPSLDIGRIENRDEVIPVRIGEPFIQFKRNRYTGKHALDVCRIRDRDYTVAVYISQQGSAVCIAVRLISGSSGD